MKQIIIINSAGFGKEVEEWIRLMPGFGVEYNIKGFLDDRKLESDNKFIIGRVEDYLIENSDVFVCALSKPTNKEKYTKIILDKGGGFFNVIHPSNYFSPSVNLGSGIIIGPYNSFSINSQIGDFSTIYGFSKIGHDTLVGDFVHISSHCSIFGGSQIEDYSIVEPFTHIKN